MSSLPSLLRQAAAAHRSIANGKVADLVQHCTRQQQAFEKLLARSFLSSCRGSKVEDEQTESSGITGKSIKVSFSDKLFQPLQHLRGLAHGKSSTQSLINVKFPGAEESEEGSTLPENATAAEMRQWADRMLGQNAASKSGDCYFRTPLDYVPGQQCKGPEHKLLSELNACWVSVC